MALAQCPYCNKSAMTVVQKAFRGSRKSYECNSCGKLVGISKWARLVGLVSLASLVLFGWILGEYVGISEDAPNLILALVMALVLHALLQTLVVPVVAREPVEQDDSS
jgi:hypothetical protein